MRSPDLRQVNMIIESLYMMKNGTMNISRTVQNQTAKYIFSLMTFCDKTHKPLWFWGPPAAPTFGTVQLTLKISREGGLKIQISLFVFSPGKNQCCLNTFAILKPNWVIFFLMHSRLNHKNPHKYLNENGNIIIGGNTEFNSLLTLVMYWYFAKKRS